jgi:4-amino-4-deoxy-L-arabinose transferase-like glycosyltransferase
MRRIALLLILFVALATRLTNAVFVPWQGGDMVVSDMKGYDRAAVALLEQEPLAVHTAERYLFHSLGSDTYHPPAYYYFLAGVYAVAGHSYLAVRIAQAGLDVVTCWLIYQIGTDLFGAGAGWLAAALAAFYPVFIFYTGVLLTETLSTCLLAGSTLLRLHSARPDGQTDYRRLAPTGLLLGLAALTRSVLLLIVPLALVWLWFVRQPWPGWRSASRSALALLLPVVLLIGTIAVRNYQIHHRLVLISTNGGVNFFLGHGGNEQWKNEIRNIPETYSEGQLIGISSRTATEEEAYFYQLGWEYTRAHPLRTLRSLPAKFREMYCHSEYWPASEAQLQVLRAADRYLWPACLLLVCSGIVFFRGQRLRQAALLYGIVLSSAWIPLVFWAQTRFRVPFAPLFIILAVGAAFEAYRRLTALHTPTAERTAS